MPSSMRFAAQRTALGLAVPTLLVTRSSGTLLASRWSPQSAPFSAPDASNSLMGCMPHLQGTCSQSHRDNDRQSIRGQSLSTGLSTQSSALTLAEYVAHAALNRGCFARIEAKGTRLIVFEPVLSREVTLVGNSQRRGGYNSTRAGSGAPSLASALNRTHAVGLLAYDGKAAKLRFVHVTIMKSGYLLRGSSRTSQTR